MWEALKGALLGVALMWVVYAFFVLFMRGCMTIAGAAETEPIERVGVYEVWGVEGKPILGERPHAPIPFRDNGAEQIVDAIEASDAKREAIESGMAYDECQRRQRFYAFVADKFRAKGDQETTKMYEDLKRECHL